LAAGFDDQDDRGAQDERFKDVPDEARDNDKRASGIAAAPALMTLEDWLASTAVRQLLVQLEELWMAGAQRVRHKTSYETMITQLYAIKHAVRFIKSVEHLSKCMRVPSNLSELHEWAPSDLLEALGELLPPPQWLERISEEKALGSAIKSVNLLMRLMSWALPLVMSRLGLQLIRVEYRPGKNPDLTLKRPGSFSKSREHFWRPPGSCRAPLIVVGHTRIRLHPTTLRPRTEGRHLSVKMRFRCHRTNRLNIDL
jgi:hypothetical protein